MKHLKQMWFFLPVQTTQRRNTTMTLTRCNQERPTWVAITFDCEPFSFLWVQESQLWRVVMAVCAFIWCGLSPLWKPKKLRPKKKFPPNGREVFTIIFSKNLPNYMFLQFPNLWRLPQIYLFPSLPSLPTQPETQMMSWFYLINGHAFKNCWTMHPWLDFGQLILLNIFRIK